MDGKESLLKLLKNYFYFPDERCHGRRAGDGDPDRPARQQHQSPAGQVGGE